MNRGIDERVADIRRLLHAAQAVHSNRALFAADIVRTTSLTPEGVELGFASLERDATDADLRALVARAGRASRVHVVLSANVFVAPLRAIASARAAAEHVTVRPSARDPVLTHALVDAMGDDAIAIVEERDVASLMVDEIHVYGGYPAIADVRGRAPTGVVVKGHGPGLGVAIVTSTVDLEPAAEGIAADVVPFDQRGCLSPRVVLVEGDDARGEQFARALHRRMSAWGVRVPRGILSEKERADASGWAESMAFAGSVWKGDHHQIALAPTGTPLTVPPSGRHVQVVVEPTLASMGARLAPIAPFVVAVGTTDESRTLKIAPTHARLSILGRMQHPMLDGPVDRRSLEFTSQG